MFSVHTICVSTVSFAWQNQQAVQHRPIGYGMKITVPDNTFIIAIAYDILRFSSAINTIGDSLFFVFVNDKDATPATS